MALSRTARRYFHTKLYKSAHSRAAFTSGGVVIMEIKMSFRQFFTWKYPFRSLFRTIAVALSALVRLLLGRSVKYSFAFAGEDKVIEGLLKPRITKPGFYVDVGCNHPTLFSNTYGLYRKGWRGVCIDANQELTDLYRLYRPRDKAVAALVSDDREERDFYQVQNDVLSTTATDFLEEYRQEGLSIDVHQLKPRLLTEILNSVQAPAVFDLLSVDTEEHDLQVLRSLDLKVYHPRLIVMEDESFDPIFPEKNEIYRYLSSFGYRLEGYVLKNLYFTTTTLEDD
jgi:hypothetical protein